MRLRQVFMWRHINSDSSRLLFGLSCDGGTKLWPVLHWLRHYWAIFVRGSVMPHHLTLGCFETLRHLSWSAPKTSCLHAISFSYTHVCLCVWLCLYDIWKMSNVLRLLRSHNSYFGYLGNFTQLTVENIVIMNDQMFLSLTNMNLHHFVVINLS